MSGCLYIVGTPIGNLSDVSDRALKTLNSVDFIVAEDCRVTLKLLNKYCIKKPVFSHHKFSNFKTANIIIKKILKGDSAAIVSDAGMPLICDPGEVLVNLCYENSIAVKVVPGPCALIAALSLSGVNCSRFTFFGFLSTKKTSRVKSLLFLKNIPHTLVFYEAPHKIVKTLKDFLKYFGDRKIIIVKEITKIHESVQIFTISKALSFYESLNSIKGEFVLIVEKNIENLEKKFLLKDAIEIAKKLIFQGEKPVEAAKTAARITNFRKNEIYKHITKSN